MTSHINETRNISWQEEEILVEVDGLGFPVIVAGNPAGIPVVLVPGWPQDSAIWAVTARRLHGAGYRTYSINLRGSKPSNSPKEIRRYRVQRMGQDILDIADELGLANFHLIGHDWGAISGWAATSINSRRIRSLTAVSAPNIQAYTKSLFTSVQAIKSLYILMLITPILPEVLLTRTKILRSLLIFFGQKPSIARRDTDRIYHNLPVARGGANYYRSNTPLTVDKVLGKISTPVLQIWGTHDMAVSKKSMERNLDFIDPSIYTFVAIKGGTHWLPDQQPDELFKHIYPFIQQH